MPIQSPTSPLVAQSSEEGIRDQLISYQKGIPTYTLCMKVYLLYSSRKPFFLHLSVNYRPNALEAKSFRNVGFGLKLVYSRQTKVSLSSSVGHLLVLKFLFDFEEGMLRESAIRHNENHRGFPGICKKMLSSSHKCPQINQKCICNIHVKISRESYIN